MSIQTARTTDQVASPRAGGHESVQAIAAESRYSRQISAIIWIVMAWVAGTIIFEITAIGSEPKHVVIETDDQPISVFFHDQESELFPTTTAPGSK